MIECIIIGLGGFLGSVCRYLIGLIPVKETTIFPVKTFMINILGAFLIGMISAITAKHSSINPRLILFLKTGICGGFTTFSTFALESANLFQAGHSRIAMIYMTASMMAGIFAIFISQKLLRS